MEHSAVFSPVSLRQPYARNHLRLASYFGFLRAPMTGMREYLSKHSKIILWMIIPIFVFYWFEIRPIQISNSCADQASANAKELVASKAAIAATATERASFQRLSEKNMYLRSDYESFYTKCMRKYGYGI